MKHPLEPSSEPGVGRHDAHRAVLSGEIQGEHSRLVNGGEHESAIRVAGLPNLVQLQRLAGNRAVAAALGSRRLRTSSTSLRDGDPGQALDQSVMEGEIRDVTAQPNVSATRSVSGRHVLIPEQHPPPPPPIPRVHDPPEILDRPAAMPVQERQARREQEIRAATATAIAQLPADIAHRMQPGAAGRAVTMPSAPPGELAAPEPPARPSPQDRAGGLVPPSSPDTVRAQLPQGVPTQEDFLADFADTRPLADKKAQAEQEIVGLRATGSEHKATLSADVAGHRQTVRQHGQVQQAAVRARLAATTTEVIRRTSDTKATLQAAAGRGKEALKAQVDQDVATIGQLTVAKVAEARAALAVRRQALTDAAEQERTGALAVADAEATRAVGELEAAAVECEQAGEHTAGRFAGEEDPKPKQRAAARKVGRESAADIRAKKGSIPGRLRQSAADHGRRCVEYVQGVIRKLNQTEQTLVTQLQDAGKQAQATVRDELPGAVAAVDGRLRQDTAALDATASATRQELQSAATRTMGELNTGVAAAEHELDTATTAVHRQIDNTVDETATVVAEPEHPFLPGVLEQIGVAKTGMASTTEVTRTHLATATGGAETRFAAVTQAFNTAAGPLVGQLGGQHDQIRAGFTAAVNAVQAHRREAAARVLADLQRRQQSVTDAVLAEADKASQQARSELAGMNGKFREGIHRAADRSVEEGKRPRTDDVHTRAQAAAQQAGEGWLAGLGRALVQIAIGFIVLVTVALLVAVIAVAFGPILTLWTAIMIAGAILLVAGLIFSLIRRLGQKELQGNPGLAIVLALSDTIGLTGIIESIRGKELITDTPLSDADKTERGVLGWVTLISLVLFAAAAIKGPPGGSYTRPTELPPGWRGVIPRMWRGGSSVGVELWNGLVSGVKSLKDWVLRGKGGTPAVRDPVEFGRALGEEVRGMPRGKRFAIAQRVSQAGFSQLDAATAVRVASEEAFGSAGIVRLGNGDVAVISVKLGPNAPIFLVRPNGSVVLATATLVPRVPPDLNNPFEVRDIKLESP